MKEITIIHGFGIKSYDSAIYIDGKLFSSNAHLDDAEDLIKLIKKMAKNFSIKWVEFTAPEIFRLNSYHTIPKTLAMYEKDAIAIFKELSTLDSIKNFVYYSALLEDRQIENIVYKTYTLSGGLDKNFEDFYNDIYKKTYSADIELEKEYAYLNTQYNKERYGDKDKLELIYTQMNKVETKLADKFQQQLQFVWDHPKKLDNFKKLAIE